MRTPSRIAVAALLCLCAGACAQAPRITLPPWRRPVAQTPGQGDAALAVRTVPAVGALGVVPPPPQDAASTPDDPAAGGPSPGKAELVFHPVSASLTEALDRTLDLVSKERARNDLLRREIEQLADEEARERDKTVRLEADLKAKDEQVLQMQRAVEKWKADVAAFREEMRKAEETEAEALIEVLTLLKGLRIERPAAEGARPASGTASAAPMPPAAMARAGESAGTNASQPRAEGRP